MTTTAAPPPDSMSDALDDLIMNTARDGAAVMQDPEAIRREGLIGSDSSGGSMAVNVQYIPEVILYDTNTGLPTKFDSAHKDIVLQYKRGDGTPMWSETQPTSLPERAQYACLLHPGDPRRPTWDRLGLRKCMKATLRSPKQVKDHLRVVHSAAAQTIEDWMRRERENRDREETREDRKRMTAALEAIAHRDAVSEQAAASEQPAPEQEPEPETPTHTHVFTSDHRLAGCTEDGCNVRRFEVDQDEE